MYVHVFRRIAILLCICVALALSMLFAVDGYASISGSAVTDDASLGIASGIRRDREQQLAPYASRDTDVISQTYEINRCCGTPGTQRSSQLDFRVNLTTHGVLRMQYNVPAIHCSDIRLHILVDDQEVRVTEFIGPVSGTMTTGSLDLGPVASGAHSLTLSPEGRIGGCNTGWLYNWFGTLIVNTDGSTISGRVTDANGIGISGVTVWASFPLNTTTDATGDYTFTGLPAGTYTIRPDKEPCTFAPATQTVTVPPGMALPDFRSVRLESGLDICVLEPGDILLKAGAPVGDYTDLIRFWIKLGGSYFTHSALYLGVTSDPQNPAQTGPRIAEAAGKKKLGGSRDDEVWETWLADTQWWDGENVTDWAVVQPAASSMAKVIAIQYARDKTADPDVVFDFLANLADEQKFYCSKLVWKSYQQAGLDVHKKTGLTGDLTSYWVTPEDLYFGSPVVQNMPGVDPSTRAFFRIYSPAHITLIDPLGRRTGFDSTSGGEVNEIPGALYSGADAQIESIMVAGLGSSEGWRLLATGYASGTYALETGYLDGRTRNRETHATTSEGKVDEYPVRSPNYPSYLPLLLR